MRPAALIATLKARVKTHLEGTVIRPSMIEGSPGIGKTQIVQGLALELGIGFKSIHGPLMLAEDFGMPVMHNGALSFAVPEHKFPFVGTDCEDQGIMVVDELSQMDPPQQKIMANMFQERELHGRKIKPGWHFIATGNRQQDRAGANRILSHLNDRMTTYELDVSHADWSGWALTHGVRPEVVAFINFRPDLLNKFDPAMPKNPTPRSWAEGVSRAIDTVPNEGEFETYKGDVGEGPASEFTGFIRTFRELPNPDLVLARPDTHDLPAEANIRFALCGALAHRASVETIGAIITVANRLPSEFAVLLIRDSISINPDVQTTKEYMQWAIREGAKILMG